MVTKVEDIETHRVGSTGRPQAQRVDIGAAPADDWCVIGDRANRFRRVPDLPDSAGAGRHGFHPAAVKDIVGYLRALELPRVQKGQPLFGVFLLPAVLDDLAEQTVVVADAVTPGR